MKKSTHLLTERLEGAEGFNAIASALQSAIYQQDD